MRIVNVIQRYPPAIGGAEKWCRENCQYMLKKGMQVKVLTTDLYNIEDFINKPGEKTNFLKFGRLDYDGKVLVKRYRITMFPSWCYRMFTVPQRSKTVSGFFFHSPNSLEMYIKMVKEMKDADLVHLHALPYFHNLVGLLVAKALRKEVIITPHFHPGHPHYERKVIYWLLKKCNGILTVTEYEKTYLIRKGINSKKLFVSGNWINPEVYQKENFSQFKKELFSKYNIGIDDKIVLFIGKKYIHKGMDTLIEAVRRLNLELNFRLFLFMIGPNTAEFKNYYSNMDNTEKTIIIDLGIISHQQKVNLLHGADLLVLPSKFEAFGIVLLEAWLCGTPVITCSFGASKEIVANGGLVFNYGDEEELKEKIMTILNNRRLSRDLAETGRKSVITKYTPGVVGKKVFQAYNIVRNKRKKILLVSHLFPPNFIGGSELIAYQQAMALKKRGHDIHVFCGKLDNQAKHYKITREKNAFSITRINLRQVDFDHLSYANYDKQEIQTSFRRTLYKFSPDIVHFHNIFSLSAKMIDECYNMNIPTVMTLHDYWPICYKIIMLRNKGEFCPGDNFNCLYCQSTLQDKKRLSLPARNRLFKSSFDKIDCFISPSKYLADVFSASWILKDNIKVIRNGIDLQRFDRVRKFKKSRNKHINFAFIGYLSKHKGIENLLLAFALLKNKDQARLSLMGESSRPAHYKLLADKLKIAKFVQFVGQIPNKDIHRQYKWIDVLILPSIWPENSPVSITEAMASRIPVIASNVGGIRELVDDGVTGLLFEHRSPEELAEKMQEFIAHPEQIEIMGNNGYEKIKRCRLNNQIESILQEYERVIDENA